MHGPNCHRNSTFAILNDTEGTGTGAGTCSLPHSHQRLNLFFQQLIALPNLVLPSAPCAQLFGRKKVCKGVLA